MSKEKLTAIDAELQKHRKNVFGDDEELASLSEKEISRLLKVRATIPDPERDAAVAKRDDEFRFRTESVEPASQLVSSIASQNAIGVESSFREALSQKVLSAIEDRRPEVFDSMFDTEGNYQRESFTPDEEDPQRRKANYGYPYGWNNQSGDNFLNGQEPEEDEEEEEDEEGGGDEGFDGGGAMSEAANWPRKAHSIHSDIEDAGYTYQRTNGKFHVYENPDGDQIRHSFPTLNGNHSFAHYDLNGHPLFKSSNTGDTDIKEHLKKVKKPSHGSVQPVRESADNVSHTLTNSMANAIGIAHKLHQRKPNEAGFPIWKKGDDWLVQQRKSDITDSGWEHVATRFPQHTEVHKKDSVYSHFGEELQDSGSVDGFPTCANCGNSIKLRGKSQEKGKCKPCYDSESRRDAYERGNPNAPTFQAEAFNSGWKEDKDAGSSGWLERRHKAADASGNVWKYEDARGVEKHGYLSGYSDFGGTDHIQWMRDHKTGQLDLVSGSRLKAANIVPRSKKAELLGLKVESCISESQTYGTPGCRGCENDTYNGVCMDCTRARAKSATTRGGCKCGSKKVPSTVKSNGLGRSWISCDRCLGQIKQLS